MTVDEQMLADIQNRVHADIENTLRRHFVRMADPDMHDDLVSDLVNDAMNQVEFIVEHTK